MKTPLHLLFLTSLLFAGVSPARQVVMDFDHLPASGPLNTIGSPQLEDGLRLTNTSLFYIFGPGSGRSTGHKSMANQFTGSITTLAAQNGAPFTLVSMRLSPYSANSEGTVTFTGTKAGGSTVTASLTTGTALAGVVRTFPATFQDVVSVTWNMTAGNTYHQFDDITAIITPEVIVSPPVTVMESSGSATAGVTLSEALSAPLSIGWGLTPGSATSGTDYGASPANGTFNIPAGQMAWTISIPIVNDTAVEALEDFTVVFGTNATNVVFPNSQSTTTVKIASDDGVTGFPGWMAAHGLTANDALPEADPNGDGIRNIETWLYRINPAGPSPAAVLDRRATLLIDGAGRPALRFTVPVPLPSDVRIRFEETTDLSSPWSLQVDRTGWSLGSLWSGTGSNRVTETTTTTSRTVTCASSTATRNRPKAFLRMKYDYSTGGGSN